MALLKRQGVPQLGELAQQATAIVAAGLASTGRAAISCRPASGPTFAAARESLAVAAAPRARLVHWDWDVHGNQWAVLTADSLRRIAIATARVEKSLDRRGFGALLRWTVVALRDVSGRPVQLVYDHRHPCFYPFAPGSHHDRDEAAERSLVTTLTGLLPMAQDPAQWHPLWDNPLCGP